MSDTASPGETSGVCLVIPTYNEAGNITQLLHRLVALNPAWQILIVDDSSPDGTAELVRDFAETHPQVHLSLGQKRGLGAAYKRGMGVALEQLNARIVVQMDADFSHDPKEIARLVQLVRDGADVAIGSRYVADASIDVRWAMARRWLSGGGNWLARHIAGIRGVRDCTSGFKAIGREVLERADVVNLPVNGYAFQIALLHRLIHCDASIVEHPIRFGERAHGETKLGLADLVEFFISVWILRFPSARTFTRFILTGASGTLVNLLAFQVLLELGAHKYLASPIAVEISILWNFALNNYWTFADRELIGNRLVRGLRFNMVSFGTLGISFGIFLGLTTLFPQWPPLLVQLCAIPPAALFNYFINSYWTFRARRP